MLFGLPLLSLVIWLPIFAGIGVLATGGDRNAQLARRLALAGSVAGLLVAIPLYTQFDPLMNAMQFVEHSAWIERFNIHYHLGVDGIAMPLILLNCFTTPLVIIAGWQVMVMWAMPIWKLEKQLTKECLWGHIFMVQRIISP